jgi:hypothetical protein
MSVNQLQLMRSESYYLSDETDFTSITLIYGVEKVHNKICRVK